MIDFRLHSAIQLLIFLVENFYNKSNSELFVFGIISKIRSWKKILQTSSLSKLTVVNLTSSFEFFENVF